MRHIEAELIHSGGDELGECPVWDPVRAELLWTDIQGRRLHRLPDGAREPITIALERRLCAFAVTDVGLLIAAFDTGLAFLDRQTGDVEWLGDVEPERPQTRCNDGRPDRHGSFVFGTMVESVDRAAVDRPLGAFYQWNAGRGITPLFRSASISNGLCFGADGLTMYYADSLQDTVWRARYHPQHALLIEDEVFVGPRAIDGAPDGACVDSEGTVWNARWGASGVVAVGAGGEPTAFVAVGVPNVSACCFGGPDLDRLYITTARDHLDPTAADYERSGSLWMAEVGVTGIADTPVVSGRA